MKYNAYIKIWLFRFFLCECTGAVVSSDGASYVLTNGEQVVAIVNKTYFAYIIKKGE